MILHAFLVSLPCLSPLAKGSLETVEKLGLFVRWRFFWLVRYVDGEFRCVFPIGFDLAVYFKVVFHFCSFHHVGGGIFQYKIKSPPTSIDDRKGNTRGSVSSWGVCFTGGDVIYFRRFEFSFLIRARSTFQECGIPMCPFR